MTRTFTLITMIIAFIIGTLCASAHYFFAGVFFYAIAFWMTLEYANVVKKKIKERRDKEEADSYIDDDYNLR